MHSIIMFGNGKYLGIETHGIIMFGNGKFSTQKRTASLCSVMENILHHGTKIVPRFRHRTHGIIMFGNGKFSTQKRTASLCSVIEDFKK